MTDITIRKLEGDEKLEVMYGLNAYAFHASPPLMNKDEWQEPVRQREGVTYFALFEDGEPVAGAAGTTMTQQVRGALFAANGIWAVATAPGARRQGYCRQVMADLLAALRQDGQAFSTLYPFRESFYERLGYVTFPLPRLAKLTPLALLPLLEQDLGGQVEWRLIGDGYDIFRDYLTKMQQRTHGMAMFVPGDRFAAQRNRLWLVLAKVAGEPVGLMLYQLKGEEVTQFLLRATRFYYHTSQGRYLLLQWIARHADQASQVEIWLPPYEQPETWLADLGVKTESQVRAPMARLLDITKIGGMHTGPGCLAICLHDPLCPWNEGVWQLETVAGRLQVSAGERPAGDLSVQGLTALLYGTHDPGDFALRGWGHPTPAVQATMRTMFPPLLPYIHEYF